MKGASGSKPRLLFKHSLVQRFGPVVNGDPYARTLSTSCVVELDSHTADSIYDMADMLTYQVRMVTHKEFKVLQQALGLTYDPDTILLDPDIREIVGATTGTFLGLDACFNE